MFLVISQIYRNEKLLDYSMINRTLIPAWEKIKNLLHYYGHSQNILRIKKKVLTEVRER